jgi:hypothetical protein
MWLSFCYKGRINVAQFSVMRFLSDHLWYFPLHGYLLLMQGRDEQFLCMM